MPVTKKLKESPENELWLRVKEDLRDMENRLSEDMVRSELRLEQSLDKKIKKVIKEEADLLNSKLNRRIDERVQESEEKLEKSLSLQVGVIQENLSDQTKIIIEYFDTRFEKLDARVEVLEDKVGINRFK